MYLYLVAILCLAYIERVNERVLLHHVAAHHPCCPHPRLHGARPIPGLVLRLVNGTAQVKKKKKNHKAHTQKKKKKKKKKKQTRSYKTHQQKQRADIPTI
eukprot:TRINITY_DN1603_c0_g2_i1.p2 TRINITY_DN1603_c0_g2~~TRINITY_DN1603_c0_g2_i1.p2  ORF type:complete len:100 (-),score=31.05 TRINITY_DN1603_c0_g2_i1:39-338(-)